MGACFLTGSLPDDKEEAIRQFEAAQDVDRHDNGHEYSGGWGQCNGMLFTSERFKSAADATAWLEEHAEKWGPALAVRIEGSTLWHIGAWCAS